MASIMCVNLFDEHIPRFLVPIDQHPPIFDVGPRGRTLLACRFSDVETAAPVYQSPHVPPNGKATQAPGIQRHEPEGSNQEANRSHRREPGGNSQGHGGCGGSVDLESGGSSTSAGPKNAAAVESNRLGTQDDRACRTRLHGRALVRVR